MSCHVPARQITHFLTIIVFLGRGSKASKQAKSTHICNHAIHAIKRMHVICARARSFHSTDCWLGCLLLNAVGGALLSLMLILRRAKHEKNTAVPTLHTCTLARKRRRLTGCKRKQALPPPPCPPVPPFPHSHLLRLLAARKSSHKKKLACSEIQRERQESSR